MIPPADHDLQPPAPSAHPWLRDWVYGPMVSRLRGLSQEKARLVVEGSVGSSTTLLAGALAAGEKRPVLLVVAHLDDADDALDDLGLFDAAGLPLARQRFGALEALPGETGTSLELLAERLGVVERLTDPKNQADDASILIAPIQALMQAVPTPDAIGDFSLTLGVGSRQDPDRLIRWLDSVGYTRVDAIEQPGEYAMRGGIVDLFLPGGLVQAEGFNATAGAMPVRLDFFGDEIDTLTEVNTDTMGSGRPLKRVQVVGASAEKLQSDQRTTSLMELLPKGTLVVLQEVLELSEQARGYYERLTNPRGIYAPRTVLERLTHRPHVQVNQYSATLEKQLTMRLPVRPLPALPHDAAEAIAELGDLTLPENETPPRVVVVCDQEAEKRRVADLLKEHAPAAADRIELEVGYLHRGFGWEEGPEGTKGPRDQGTKGAQSAPTASASVPQSLSPSVPSPRAFFLPSHELFHRYHTRRRIRRITGGVGELGTEAFFDLEEGDYVVHVQHGIARFKGLRSMRRGQRSEDYLTLEFANNALLHVPAAEVDQIQKYIGGFQGKPPLSLLGGKRWQKQKDAAAEAAKEMAGQMLRLQAARSSLPGVRFPADTTWQKDFEAEFPYEETEDQLAAIARIKQDMQDPQPMDRLICGDVGFGKTELAIRAAFKAAEFGKQVAVLVPTTVLAEQHEITFRRRMADYPFRIESLSRFKNAADQKKTLDLVAKGQVDIIIGTHRLLSKDVKFADLGLVIVDEEQRFGVEHKQKLLQFRMTADVLTLTATPIPRTLHMAMLGLRDISSLSTPPADRRAVVTEVIPYDQTRIRNGILRELNRDGQCYFVHNRVHDIQEVALELQKLVPEASFAVGHGQMPPRDLEKVMLKFMRGQADVFVCTTIIESGIDIPTANTMFIDQADIYGLADLHQLRGRVGRWKHRAYCYLLLPQERPVTDKAIRRLKAIEQYAMLGAGFKIAMRDLEIRGAGNLLGAEQSGHIATVGYEMYCQLLEREARRLRDGQVVEPVNTHLELPIVGRIPPAYIPANKQRLSAYKRLARCESFDQYDAAVKDIEDAYGKPPESVRDLLDLAELRTATGLLGVESVKIEKPDVIFRTREPQKLDPMLKAAPGRATLVDERTVYWRPPENYLAPPSTLLAVLRKLLVRPLRDAAQAAG